MTLPLLQQRYLPPSHRARTVLVMPNTMWEYKIQRLLGHWEAEFIETELNKSGQDGWEAVGSGWMAAGPSGGGDAFVLLKRQVAARN